MPIILLSWLKSVFVTSSVFLKYTFSNILVSWLSNFLANSTAAAAAKSLQSCRTLIDPIDGSPPGSSVHGIFQARVLEWGAIAFSKIPLQ